MTFKARGALFQTVIAIIISIVLSTRLQAICSSAIHVIVGIMSSNIRQKEAPRGSFITVGGLLLRWRENTRRIPKVLNLDNQSLDTL